MMRLPNDRDRRIAEAYSETKGVTVPQLARQFGVKPHDIRGALDRCRRDGVEVKRKPADPPAPKPQRDDVTAKRIPKVTAAQQRDGGYSSISLPRLRILEIDGHRPKTVRIVTPPPSLSAEEELKMRRLAQIKAVHQAGLRRGLFHTRSR